MCRISAALGFTRYGTTWHDIGQRNDGQFPCAAAVAGPAFVRRWFKRADTLINRSHGRFREMREMLLQKLLMFSKSSRLERSSVSASCFEHGFKAGVHLFLFYKLPALR